MNLHTYMHRIHTLLATVLAVLLLQSCSSSYDDELEYANSVAFAPTSVFEGKWTVGGTTDVTGTVLAYANNFRVAGVPCLAILRQLYPGSEIAVPDNVEVDVDVPFAVMSTSDTSQLYSLQPTTWRVMGMVDGVWRDISLAVSPVAGDTDNVSWGTYSKSGVLTLVMHATSFAAQGDEPTPISLKLVFTATRKK